MAHPLPFVTRGRRGPARATCAKWRLHRLMPQSGHELPRWGSRLTRLLVALTPYAVAPPRHGPQIRLAGELGNLGEGWRVVHFSQSIQRTDLPWPPRTVQGGERWVEHRLRDPVAAAWLV